MSNPLHRRLVAILGLLGLSWGFPVTACMQAMVNAPGVENEDGIVDIRLERPLKSSLRLLATGELVTVSIDHWNAAGLHGSHGSIAWDRIQYESVKRVFPKLMDRNEPEHWILLGTLQLSHPQSSARSEGERSFEEALKRDSSLARRITAARLEASRVVERRDAAMKEALREVNEATRAPGGADWLPIPWESLSFSESRARFRTHRTTVLECLRESGLESFFEHDAGWLMIFTDLPALELAEVLEDLERLRVLAASPFRLEPDQAPFRGKMILILCDRREDFERLEQRCFDSPVGPTIDATCHATGPSILINLHHAGVHSTVLAQLLGQLSIAAQHHHVSPAPLPRWAFEGVRDHVISRLEDRSALDRSLRLRGNQFIRGGGDLGSILARSLLDAEDPEVDPHFRALAYLTCSLMIRENPEAFAEWIRAVKSGADWRVALTDCYGADWEQILHVTREWHLLND
ncbi:MAG: hypothetical protein VX641_04865 [Planctomycetota bacterium]|nr:hypothetical protein [Planctomycetota bacterium]